MTQPTNPPVKVAIVEGSDAHESQQNDDLQLATGAQARLEEEQHVAWLREGPEVFHAPGTHVPSRKTIGLSTLALVVSGLAVAAMAHILAPGPVSSEPQARPPTSNVLATHAPSTVPPAPVATTVTAATPDAPVSPASPVLAPAAPKPEEHGSIAGGTAERRSSRHKPLAPPSSPAPALPEMTAARWPSSKDGDQKDTAQPAPLPQPSQDRQHQQSQWRWKKTTTCDSSGRCVDHYNPVPSDQ